MHKNWAAMLSMIGLAGSAVRVQSQAVNGSANASPGVTTEQGKNNQKTSAAGKTDTSGKLSVNQQTLRQQNQGNKSNGGKQADTMTPSAYCNKGNNGKANNQQVTKGGNQQVTKGSPNAQVTKGSPNAQVTKGSRNAQVTKGTANTQVTKGSAVQTTAAATPK
jgi:hypothetical protein